jgi:predicted GIY-YIG superfamily endonuclease
VRFLRAITHSFAVRSVFRPSREGAILAAALRVADLPKRFVYLLRSLVSGRPYVGVTSDMAARLAAHNADRCTHTARYKPWSLVVVIEFADEARVLEFEHYLKSGSGWAFSRRHFL